MFIRYFNKEERLIREFIKKGFKEQLVINGALFVNRKKLICTVFTEHAIPKLIPCSVKVKADCFIVHFNGALIATIDR
jgi:uncharacterized membrane-anchored protein YitT (DUF2179 family)